MNKKLILIALLCLNCLAEVRSQEQDDLTTITNSAIQFRILSSQEEWTQAKPFVERAYQLGQAIYSESDPAFGPIAYQLGAVLVALKEPSAVAPLTQAKNNYERHLGVNTPELIPVLSDLTSAHIISGNLELAQTYIARTLQVASNEYGDNATIVAELSARAGREFAAIGDINLALELQKRAHAIYLGIFGASSSKTGEAAYDISETFKRNGNLIAQVTFLQKTVTTFSRPKRAESNFERLVHTKLVKAYHALDKSKRATKHVLALVSPSSTGELQAPTLLFKASATYDGRNESEKLEGFVSLKFDVDSSGFVRKTAVLEFEGDRKLIKLATNALKGYRYIPAARDGEPVETRGMETKIVFKWAVQATN